MASGDTKTEHLLDVLANGSRADIPADNCCNTKTQNYILGAVDRMISLEEEVEELQNNPDVTDIVSTYQDLTNYDKTTLTDGDVIRVLTDSTHDDESAYYRYNAATDSFDYIGTTRAYTDFVGTSGGMAGAAGLVPAPQATDADKYLKSDGTWATVSGGGGGTTNYNSLSNKPRVNNVTLQGNKTLSELGIQPAGNYLTTETDPVFSASPSAGITSSDITSWDNKQAALVSGTNIKTINNQSLLGSGNITIEGGGSSSWGNITGDIDNQTDLMAEFGSKADVDTIGDLADLTTDLKSNVVAAINNVNGQTYDNFNGETKGEPITASQTEDGCLTKDGTVNTAVGQTNTYFTSKYIVDMSSYSNVYISGRQFNYSNYTESVYPWGADACICVAFDSSDNVLQYWQLPGAGTDYSDYEITLPNDCSYLKISGKVNQAGCKPKIEGFYNKKLPEYWKTYLENTKIPAIKAKSYTVGANGDSFVFITDIHGKLNFGKSPLLINYILKRTPIRNVIMGGDLWSDGISIPEKAILLEKLCDIRVKYDYTDKVFAVRGNHDVERNISDGEWYSIYERPLTEFTDTVGQIPYFYRDNISQKIRYIFCDGPNPSVAMPTVQQNWLKEKITELETGWTVLVFCHSYWEPAYIGSNPPVSTFGTSIKNAIDSVASTCDATVAALITGHVHRDIDTTSSVGYKIIATTCDANDWLAYRFDPVTPNRVEGTTSEQVFDVFNIDTSSNKIYITRIGGNGADREFTYTKPNVPLQSISINAESSYSGETFTPTIEYVPSDTTQTGVTWSITSGGTYATIDSNTGVVTIDPNANGNDIVVTATSTQNLSITADKTITVTYHEEAQTDITNQFSWVSNPVGFATGWAPGDTGASHNLNVNPGINSNLQHSNFVNIEGYDKLIVTNVTRRGATGPSGPTGGWAFYGSNDTTDTITLTTPYTYGGVTCYDGPAQFIEEGAMDRQHNGTQEGITTDTLIIPQGAKYFRCMKWTKDTYGAFSCIGVKE